MTSSDIPDRASGFRLIVFVTCALIAACAMPVRHGFDVARRIEHRYSVAGPYPVSRLRTPATFGRPGGVAYIPVNPDGPVPLVIWQNGTGETITTYDAIARHLASWGLAVIGSDDRQMGSGDRAIALLEDSKLWSRTPDHPLFGRILPQTFAFLGSSQGAVGSINAHTRSAEGRRATALAVHGTPTQQALDFFRLDLSYDATSITAPVLILTGTQDAFISPVRLNRNLFDSLSGPGLRVFGVAKCADHIALADDAGVFRGYLTAWLTFHLLGDPLAAQAFTGPTEIMTNPGWSVTDVAP
ncbi:hypothetical protein [uncultured Tateyamaria sp.]|uniref:hypothetical protein n=1 Tax=Tateyamaria sp. 1078 TaxID=3417464 RepID=UPI00262A8995|nr:hypothetical protein [uncultured Tateyamaria sp.]